MNLDKWNSLGAEVQGFIMDELTENGDYYLGIEEKLKNDGIDQMLANGMEFI
jgi:TRAP-type C4-dicarboxylate transport system substrate-binding protein